MPEAKRKRCEYEPCNRLFYAPRSDAKYCSERCRSRVRMEDARFRCPRIPKSGVPGITWNRYRSRWVVKVKIDGEWKYVGSFHDLAIARTYKYEIQKAAS